MDKKQDPRPPADPNDPSVARFALLELNGLDQTGVVAAGPAAIGNSGRKLGP